MNRSRPARLRATAAGLLLSMAALLAVGADYLPMDHAGAALTLADGDSIWGEHTGLSHFEIPATATVTIRRHMPDTPQVQQTGWLIVRAETILIAGTLDATAAGHTGGGGFGGEKGALKECPTCPDIFYEPAAPGERGHARYGGSEPDGPARGELPGQDGGYDIAGGNADNSTGTIILMGSGAQGGLGGAATAPNPIPWTEGSRSGGGGGGGGPGGGAISLFAETSLIITGQILTRGRTGGNGYHGEDALLADICDIDDIFNRPCLAHHEADGGDGGSTDAGFQQPEDGLGGYNGDQSRAQSGGAGGGGGALLHCEAPGGLIMLGGMDARGGREQLDNGGTVKIFFRPPLILPDPAAILAPRLYLRNLDGPAPADAWLAR